ncbi:MAG: 2OG-Fe(II) oxygenase [Rhodobacteraceae bacterium]|nr:2OG-Fe(II) oxygenase [Paracoccaceae bacterium]
MKDIVKTERYPLDDIGGAAWRGLVAQARADLARHGMYNLSDFLRADARERAVTELAPKFETESYVHKRRHNIYFRRNIEGLPADHPALREVETINRTLCADQIGGAVAAIYRWDAFTAFLAATLDKPVLYPMADPLAACNVMCYGEGEGLNWHFDRSEFTVTLLLQAPLDGGAFEYRSDLRSDGDPNYDGVARLLRNEDPDKRSLTLQAGTLNVFRGRNTAHRVTPVRGKLNRIIAVLTYFERPGVRFTAEEQMGFYGRTG